jgi:hypothetical protein
LANQISLTSIKKILKEELRFWKNVSKAPRFEGEMQGLMVGRQKHNTKKHYLGQELKFIKSTQSVRTSTLSRIYLVGEREKLNLRKGPNKRLVDLNYY